ncbi:MAG: hypothetical protein JXB00_04070 [Bacteroidales bacterium]|nr:hypothetical protein [Bacteroidales bacterium]
MTRQNFLPEESISLIGRSLQFLFPDSFTESHLNSILRGLVNYNSGGDIKHSTDINGVENCIFHFKLFCGPCKKEFQQFTNQCLQKASCLNPKITISLEPPEHFDFYNPNITIDSVIVLLNDILFIMQHGVWNINAEKLFIGGNTSSQVKTRELVQLIFEVAHTANADVVFTHQPTLPDTGTTGL